MPSLNSPSESDPRTCRRPGRWLLVIPAVLLPLALALPFFFGDVFLFRDLLHFNLPQQLFAVDEVRQGRLPLWNPLLFGGMPFLSEPGTGVFYLPNLVFHLASSERAATLFVLLHLPLAGAGAFLFARRLGASPLGAAGAGVVFVGSGYLLSMHGGHYYFAGTAWLPLAAALLLGLARRHSIRAVVVAALPVAAMVLNGEFQSLAFACGLGGLLALVRAPRVRVLGALAASVLLGVGLGAVQFAPTVAFAATTVRAGGLPLEQSSLWALHPARWLEFLVPLPFGIAYPENSQWSAAFMDSLRAVPWAPGLYLGPAALALAAAAGLRRRGGREAWWLAAAGVFALLLAAGGHLPLFALWHRFVPGASAFRFPEKYAAVFTLAIALLAGLGMSRVEAGHRVRALRLVGWGAAAVLGAAAIAAHLGRGLLEPWIARGIAASSATIAPADAASNLVGSLLHGALIAAALALICHVRQARPALFGPALLALLTVDAASAGLDMLSFGDGSMFREPPAVAAELRRLTPPGSAGRFHRSRTCRYSGGGEGETLLERVRAFEWHSGKENFLMREGLPDALGYSAAEDPKKLEVWRAAGAGGLANAARLFGAAVLIECDPRGLRLEPVAGALPRAFVAPAARSVSREQVLEFVAEPGWDATALALVEGDAPPAGEGDRAVEVRDRSPSEVEVRTRGGGTLVLLDSFAPGWSVEVDGSPAPLQRAFGLYRAVGVPDGEHTVVFRYFPPGLIAGATISGVALILALTGFVFGAHRRRRLGASSIV